MEGKRLSNDTQKPDLDFIGIGAAKSGTTWLTTCLAEHPDIFIPTIKEVCFFHDLEGRGNYQKGFAWYNSFFKEAKSNQKKGEYTNQYMIAPDSAELIEENYPNIKLIACLRNPVDMIYSLYWWRKATVVGEKLPDTFEEALKKEDFLNKAKFGGQLKKFYDFFPKEQIKVILFEDLKQDPEKIFGEVLDFIDVEKFSPPSLNKKVNVAKESNSKILNVFLLLFFKLLKKLNLSADIRNILSKEPLNTIFTKLTKKDYNYPKISDEAREQLKKYYIDDIDLLESLIDKDLSPWKNA